LRQQQQGFSCFFVGRRWTQQQQQAEVEIVSRRRSRLSLPPNPLLFWWHPFAAAAGALAKVQQPTAFVRHMLPRF